MTQVGCLQQVRNSNSLSQQTCVICTKIHGMMPDVAFSCCCWIVCSFYIYTYTGSCPVSSLFLAIFWDLQSCMTCLSCPTYVRADADIPISSMHHQPPLNVSLIILIIGIHRPLVKSPLCIIGLHSNYHCIRIFDLQSNNPCIRIFCLHRPSVKSPLSPIYLEPSLIFSHITLETSLFFFASWSVTTVISSWYKISHLCIFGL